MLAFCEKKAFNRDLPVASQTQTRFHENKFGRYKAGQTKLKTYRKGKP
jgi:hypothetical protein